jgi:hypothetical protein
MSEENVPEWVREIEARLAPFPPMFFGTDAQGNTATITFTPPTGGLLWQYGDAIVRLLGPAIHDMARLCKEVRELLAIISDLKEDRATVFLVFRLGGYALYKLCHSRHEAEVYAREVAASERDRFVVSLWTDVFTKEISLWGVEGRLCLPCDGSEGADCEACKGDGKHHDKEED